MHNNDDYIKTIKEKLNKVDDRELVFLINNEKSRFFTSYFILIFRMYLRIPAATHHR